MSEKPTYCQVGPHVYTVKWDYTYSERFDYKGSHDSNSRVIFVAKAPENLEMPQTEKLSVLFHEIVHAGDSVTGHDMFHEEKNDSKIDGIVNMLLQAVLSNPAIPRMLLEESLYQRERLLQEEVKA